MVRINLPLEIYVGYTKVSNEKIRYKDEEYIIALQLKLGVSCEIKSIDVADYLDFHYMASSN